jgi:alpha-acetolactate decarboxylase
MPIPELLRHGDFGVGTLDHLDGELVILDGRPYQVRGDRAVVAVPSGRSSPFAIVTRFDPHGAFAWPEDIAGVVVLPAAGPDGGLVNGQFPRANCGFA